MWGQGGKMRGLMPSFFAAFAACRPIRPVLVVALAMCCGALSARHAFAAGDRPTAALPAAPSCLVTVESAAPIVADGTGTVTFRFEASGEGLAAGDTVEIRFPFCAPYERAQWSTPVPDGDVPGRTISSGPVDLRVTPFPLDPLCNGLPLKFVEKYPEILQAVLGKRLDAGDSFVVTYGDPGPSGHGMAVVQAFPEEDVPFRFRVRPKSGSPSLDLPRKGAALEVGRRRVERLHLSGPSTARRAQKVAYLVAALDAFGFPAASLPEGVRITATHESGAKEGPFLPSGSARDPSARRAEVTFDRDGVWWLSAEASGLDGPWDLPVVVGSEGPLGLVFGDLHWHTNRSDGSRSPQEGYRYARDVVGLDFTAKTDHDIHYSYPCLTAETWQESKDLVREFDDPGRFAALLGYEWTSALGHENVYYRDPVGDLLTCSEYVQPPKLWAALPPGKAITIPHHPASLAQPHMDWQFHDDRFVKTVEVYSNKGNSEQPNGRCAPRARGKRSEEDDRPRKGSLQEGWSLGRNYYLLASTDNHLSTPGNPVRERLRFEADDCPGHGLCGAWVRELTHEEIFDALVEGRTYGTTGPRIHVELSPWQEGDVVRGVVGRVVGTAAVREVRLVGIPRQGEPPFPERWIVDDDPHERIVRLRWSRDDGPEFRGVYLRVTQEDGEMAWSSPVFFGS